MTILQVEDVNHIARQGMLYGQFWIMGKSIQFSDYPDPSPEVKVWNFIW